MSDTLPKGWKWVKLGEVAEVVGGFAFKSQHFGKHGTPVVKIKDIKPPYIDVEELEKVDTSFYNDKNLKKYYIEKDDFVLAMTGATIGKIGILKRDLKLLINQRVAKIVPKDMINKAFIYYSINNNTFQQFIQNNIDSNSAQENISSQSIGRFPIPLPPLPEQKAIAEVLSSIDDKIDLLHRQNKTLEEMAMTLFRQWFIEPTKDGLPEGWGEKKLKDIYFLEKGIEPGSKNYLETPSIDSIRFIRVGDMLDNKANVYIQKDLVGNSICKFDDLLVSFDGTVGRVSFGIQGCYSSGIRKIYSKDEIYNKLWLKHQIFVSEDIQDEINMYAEGTTILHASSSIDYLSFAFPLKEKIEEYDKFFDPIYKKMLHNKKSIQTLEKLRDTLLPKLMSGEVRAKMEIM